MPKTAGPLAWFGGKGQQAHFILPFLPPHKTYVEAFGGGAAVLFAKQPLGVEVYNDLDSGLVHFFRVLRDPDQFRELQRLCALTPFSREGFYECESTWDACEGVERAYRWYVVARQSFSGEFGKSWARSVGSSRRQMARAVSAWLSAIDRLPEFAERILRVQIEHADFRVILDNYDTPDTCFYLDPPYVADTRKGGTYKHELTDTDHRDLILRLLNVRGAVVLSGYQTPLYEPLEAAGWRRVDREVSLTAQQSCGGDRKRRVESLWINRQ